MPIGSTFHGHVQTSRFRLPEDNSIPIILIGTGTGIAPLRGFLQKRLADKDASSHGPVLGIFGYRNPGEQLYLDEFTTTFASPKNEFLTAFSRTEAKQRVQDVITSNAAKIVALLDQGARVLLCGSHAMGREAGLALARAAEQVKELPIGEGDVFLAKLRKESRFVADTYQQAHGPVPS